MNAFVGKIVVFSLMFGFIILQDENSDIELKFDQTSIKSLKLTIKWRFKPNVNKKATKYVLFYEVGRVNMFNYPMEYTMPELLDDEEVVKASTMKRENFKNRAEFYLISSYNCSLNCLNSTNVLMKNPFECNIFSYDPSVRKCVLYEYDFYKKNEPKNNYRRRYDEYEIYDYFMDECDMDEFFIEFAGYSRMCRRIMEYRDEHSVIIKPFVDFRFSISLRDEQNKWTPFLRKEFQYSPTVKVDIIGNLKFGQNIKLVCKTDLNQDVVESISWRNSEIRNDTLIFPHFSPLNLHQTYFCEIRIGSKHIIQKAFKFDLKEMQNDLEPKLKLNYSINKQDLIVDFKWKVDPPENTQFKTEKILFLFSENGKDYKFPKKFFPFQISIWQSANFPFNKDKFYNTTDEEECAKLCIKESFCNHFVFYNQIESSLTDRFRSNCRLSLKTIDGFFPCPRFATCQNLKLPANLIKDNSLQLSILPNITYKFKIQLRDIYLNWTNTIETDPIFIPMTILVEKIGQEQVGINSTFALKCVSNVSGVNKIIWTKNDVEIQFLNKMYTQSDSTENQFLNSKLNFNMRDRQNLSDFNGKYKCKMIKDSDVSGSFGFLSQPTDVNLKLNDSLEYTKLNSNISLPTLRGVHLSLDCFVLGSAIESLNWFVDGKLIIKKNQLSIFDDMIVIESITNQNVAIFNRTLILKLEEEKSKMKYECRLNGKEVIRSHFIEIVNLKPEINLQINKSELNKLKISFFISAIRKHNQFQNLDIQIKKLSILYVQNSTFNSSTFTYIAPGTLSKADNIVSDIKLRTLIGHLPITEHNIQSCKLACFQTPLCKSYEYLNYKDNCNLYTTPEVKSFYSETIDRLKQLSLGSNLNLVYFYNDLSSTIKEDELYNYTILIDKKSYSYCENQTSYSFNQESYCNDEIADFKNTYTMDNLIPLTNYQFRIEITNIFGISRPYFTEIIHVPFKLNKILQYDVSNENKYLKLECSTDLIENNKLKFRWLRERNIIDNQDKNFSQNDMIDLSTFKSELIFRGQIDQYIGHYTCQLIYEFANTKLITNTTHLYIPKVPVTYNYEQYEVVKNEGGILSENCSASGWPLPDLKWFYKDKSLDETNQNLQGFPHSSVHHRNITSMSYLFGFDLKKNFQGVYSCLLNGIIPIKNVTLIIENESQDSNVTDKQSNTDSSKKKNESSYILINVFIGTFIIIALGIIVGLLYFLKRNKSENNALMSYNRIEEELMTGVDNVNLTDDTQ